MVGLRREHREDAEGGEDAALVGSVGVNIDGERRATGVTAGLGDRGDDGRDAARVVPVPVREEQHVDAGQVDGQSFGVGEPDVSVGAHIEQHRRGAISLSGGGEGGEAVTRDAEVVEAHDAVVPVVSAARRDAPEEVGHLRKLRHAGSDARERVGHVVDDDRDGQLVELGCCGFRGRCHRVIVPEPAPTGSASAAGSVSSVAG